MSGADGEAKAAVSRAGRGEGAKPPGTKPANRRRGVEGVTSPARRTASRRPGVDYGLPGVATYEGAKGDLLWSEPLCYDCSGCIAVCPFDAMEIEFGTVRALMDKCTLCTLCEKACPTGAIAVVRHPKGGPMRTGAEAPAGGARPGGAWED